MTKRPLPKLLTMNNPGAMRDGYGVNYQPGRDDGFSRFTHLSDGVQSLASWLFDLNVYHQKHSVPDMALAHIAGRGISALDYIENLRVSLRITNPLMAKGFISLHDPLVALTVITAFIDAELGAIPADYPNKHHWVSIGTIQPAMVRCNRWAVI